MINNIIHRDDLHHGGFAGLTEHRLVNDPKVFGSYKDPMTSNGLGAMIYMADARFNPHGETRMHPHKEVDVISVMVEGNIQHEGSLEHGGALHRGDVQVQRAGGEGFLHNEINPDDTTNRMIQVWFQPESRGEKAAYKLYGHANETRRRVYGGHDGTTFAGKTIMEVIDLKEGQSFVQDGLYEAYLMTGNIKSGDTSLNEGDLFSGSDLTLIAKEDSRFILVFEED